MTTCTCELSDLGLAFFDAVNHYPGCALLMGLEARIAGMVMAPGDLSDPDAATWYIASDGRFLCSPGVDGNTRALP